MAQAMMPIKRPELKSQWQVVVGGKWLPAEITSCLK
jgi:hypothetical protein